VVVLDKLDYCASLHNLDAVKSLKNFKFVKGDIQSADLINFVLNEDNIDTIMHFAAQTHVDNSFGNSISFSVNNIVGVHSLLECSKAYGKIELFVHVSTDEVYGESAYSSEGALEKSQLQPTNPYAASKAGAEHIALSYFKSWNFPVVITRSNNIYGPHQYPEKVIPKWICLLDRGQKCPIHGNGSHMRAFMYVDDVVAAYDLVLHKGQIGQIYNFQSATEITNFQLSEKVIKACGKEKVDEWREFVVDRAFNDLRYHVNGSKLFELGWRERFSFEEGLKKTVEWYRTHNIEEIWGEYATHSALKAHATAPGLNKVGL
jgi:UDP-glucose 4,6-dehydratase